MKIIVNSKTLRQMLKKSFEVDAHCIKAFGNSINNYGSIHFGTRKYQSDIEMDVTFTKGSSLNDVVHFKALPMVNLYNFLKTLSEQPIVVTFEDDRIRVEQFIIDFN